MDHFGCDREEGGEGEDEEEWGGPTLCTFCDDGGLMLLCDGECNRAFHVGIPELSEDRVT